MCPVSCTLQIRDLPVTRMAAPEPLQPSPITTVLAYVARTPELRDCAESAWQVRPEDLAVVWT